MKKAFLAFIATGVVAFGAYLAHPHPKALASNKKIIDPCALPDYVGVLTPPAWWSENNPNPETLPYNQQDIVCPLNSNAVVVANDEDQVWVLSQAQPTYFQYCSSQMQCGSPFMWSGIDFTVAHNNGLLHAGGFPVGMGDNKLYAIRQERAFVIMVNSSGAKTKYLVNNIHVKSKPALAIVQ